jgi:alkaline phosphatase
LIGLESNRLLLVVVILSIGLVGSLYLYFDASSGDKPPFDPGVVDGLVEELDEANEEIGRLEEANSELGERVESLESEPPVVIVEKPEIVIDVSGEGEVRNVILLIGDGMGIGQLTAAEVMNGEEDLVLTRLPYKSLVSTHSSSNYVTDSAASATALATGFKTRNGMVSVTAAGESLFTVLEDAEEAGKATGIVTTTRVTHATPACFVAHVNNRDMETVIAAQLLASGVDVALGGGSTYFSDLNPEDEGYTVVYDSTELDNIESGKVLGLFSSGYMSYESERSDIEPSLSEMTAKSLELLSSDPDGFFLMVEGGRIDHASHDNHFDNTIAETLEFDLAVLEALEYASGRNDTLILVTADHETGGLSIVGGY